MLFGFDVLNYLKKYFEIIFVDLSADAAKVVSGSRFWDILRLIDKIPMNLFRRCIQPFFSDVRRASLCLSIRNIAA